MLLLTAATNDLPVTTVIEAWQSSPLRANSFRDWLTTQSDFRVGRAQPGENWEDRVGAIFGESLEFDEAIRREVVE